MQARANDKDRCPIMEGSEDVRLVLEDGSSLQCPAHDGFELLISTHASKSKSDNCEYEFTKQPRVAAWRGVQEGGKYANSVKRLMLPVC